MTSPSPTADPLAERVEDEFQIPGGPDLPIEAFGSLWLLTPDASQPGITRLDPQSGEVLATIAGSSRLCQALGATEDAIWGCTNAGLVRIDPATNQVVATIPLSLGRFFGYMPEGDGSLWAIGGEGGLANRLVRVDPSVDEVVASYDLNINVDWLGFGGGKVWLGDMRGGKLWQFDPASEALTEHTTGLSEPGTGAYGSGSIWLAVNAGDEGRQSDPDVTLVRISPTTGEIEAELDTGKSIFEGLVHASDSAVWIRSAEPFLAHIDPATNEVTESIHLNMAGGSVALLDGSLWVTAVDYDKVWRLRP